METKPLLYRRRTSHDSIDGSKSPRSSPRSNRRPRVLVAVFSTLLVAASLYIILTPWVAGSLWRPHLLGIQWPTEDVPVPESAPHVTDSAGPLSFSLKHIYHHNTEKYPNLHARINVSSIVKAETESPMVSAQRRLYPGAHVQSSSSFWDQKLPMSGKPHVIRRVEDNSPDTMESYLAFARTPYARNTDISFDWLDEFTLVPNITDRQTVLTLAYMSSDAYVDIPFTGDWSNVSNPWDETLGVGWMQDGVRGHIFTNDAETIAIIAIKGTSAAIFDSGGDTAPNDKVNDNLLFSCCCARISYLWNTVCDCYTGESYTCNQECLEDQLYSEDRYYRAVLDIYRNVTILYPNAIIWVTGHSLGGALAALLGRTYGLPAIGFEAPGELLASKRLHLPQPPGIPVWDDHIWHFGHTADPVFMGVCNGAGSTCWIGGYAMETQCHSGLQCVYDVVDDKGWHVSLVNHRIHVVIDDVILAYNQTPACQVPPPCQDCFNWNFVSPSVPEPEKPSSSTTSKPTPTKTKQPDESDPPQKCLRRSWYGRCLEWGDEDDPITVGARATATTRLV